MEKCRGNYDFYNGIYKAQLEIYSIDNNNLKKLSSDEKKALKGQLPDVCISACRINDNRYGGLQSLHFYSENLLDDLSYLLWIHQNEADSKKQVEMDKSNNDMEKR